MTATLSAASATVTLGIALQGGDTRLAVRAGQRAEAAGFRSFWSADYYNRSALVTLAALAASTETIELGSAIAWIFGRTPLTLATDVRSIADLAPGRLSIGLGAGNPQVARYWHGIDEARPVSRMVETIELARGIWQLPVSDVDHSGPIFRCHMAADPSLPELAGKSVPLLLAGGRSAVLRAAGAVADGLVGHPLATPAFLADIVRPELERGARSRSRSGPVPITGLILCSVDEDPRKARMLAATQVAAYTTRPSADAVVDFLGLHEEARAIRNAFATKDLPAMVGAVSERMLDGLAVYGSPEEAAQRYSDRFAGMYEHTLLYVTDMATTVQRLQSNFDAVVDTFGRAQGPARVAA